MQFYNQNPIRLIELFAGIGSQAKALKNLGLDFEHWFVCEFDKYAINSYNAIHNTNFTTSDVTKITANDLNITDTEHFTYLLTYSFPCQDLSLAGKGKGMEKGSGTRSGLLWEVERLLNECTQLPQVLLMENVPQVHGSKNKEHFDKWIEFLASKGYSNYWQDLNAKDYKIPQSRNRCFMVSILGDYSYDFPIGTPLNITLKDVLEDIVDEKYYLSDPQINRMKNSTFSSASYEHRVTSEKGIMSTLLARDYKDPKCVEVCNMAIASGLVVPYDIIDMSYSSARLEEISQGIISTKNGENNQISNTIITSPPNFGVTVPYPNNKTPFITIDYESVKVREATKKGYAIAYEGDSINLEQPNSTTRRGRVGKQISHTLTTPPQQAVVEPKVVGGIGEKKSNGGRQWYQQDRIYDDGCAISVTTAFNPYYAINEPQSRIRKLTPKECWRLMGFGDDDFHKAEKVCSNSQLYKQAGNSIVVNVLMAIFKELFLPQKTRSQWLDELLGDSL